MSNSYSLGMLAIVMGIMSVITMYRHWLNTGAVSSALIQWTPWSLLAVSISAWVMAAGAEFGIVFSSAFFTMTAWFYIVLVNRKQAAQYIYITEEPKERIQQSLSAKRFLRNSSLVFLIIPVACFCSVMLCLAGTSLIPVSETSRLVIAGLLFPLLWSVLILWCCGSKKRWHPALMMFGLASVIVIQYRV